MHDFDYWPMESDRDRELQYRHVYAFLQSIMVGPSQQDQAGITWLELMFLYFSMGGIRCWKDPEISAGRTTAKGSGFQNVVRAVVKHFLSSGDKCFFVAPVSLAVGFQI